VLPRFDAATVTRSTLRVDGRWVSVDRLTTW
jgi:hypothetical protein